MRIQLTLILFLLSQLLSGQAPQFFRHFTEKDGLSSDYVTCLLREPEGYLWVGTNYGLNRYDGRQFVRFFPNSSQPDQTICNEYINALARDQAGFIWIATRKGLNRYDPRTRRFQTWLSTGNNNGSLPNSLVVSLLADGDRLWVACDNRDLAYLDLNTGIFQQVPWKKFTETITGTGNGYKTIYSIQKKSDSVLWLHTNLGLMTYDKISGQFECCPPFQPGARPVGTDDFACPESLFSGSWDADVLCYNPCDQRWSQLRLPVDPNLHDGFRLINQVARDGAQYWVLSQQGLFYFESTQSKIRRILKEKGNANHVPEGGMHVFYHDEQGLRWFGGEKGLWQLDPHLQHFQYIPLDTTPFASYANRYAQVLDVPSVQRRFISDLYRGQLLVLEKEHLIKTIPLGGQCHILKQDQSGQIWVSGGMNLFQLDPKTLITTPFPVNKALFEAGKNSYLADFEIDWMGDYWLAGNNCGILLYRAASHTWEKPTAETGFIGRNINCLYADMQHQFVWIGTEDYGLFRYDPHTQQFMLFQPDIANQEHSLGAYMVRDIGQSANGILWVATDPGGLTRFDYNAPLSTAFSNFNTADGLPSNQVCSIVADRSGRWWAGTTKGLAFVGPDAVAPIFWNKNSGLRNEYLDLPLSLGANGNIYMGGAQGVEYFNPDSLLLQRHKPSVLLNSFKVFDRELVGTFQDAIVLPWKDNFFSVEFASSNFSTPERTRYIAHLQNFEEYPQQLGQQPYRAFTKVPPGHYTLLLTAVSNNGESGFLSLKITILPPFWQTWWFQLLVLAFITGIIWGAYQLRINQIRRQEALKSAFNRRLAQVEMSALRAQMNPHFVFNCLNSINRFILINEPEAASAYLTKFSRLIRLILDNSRSETVPLDKELDALRLYIEMEAMRFEGRFEYSIDIAPSLQTEHIEVPPLLIQPFVENAIWHGLMHQKTVGKLRISVSQWKNPTAVPGNAPPNGLFIQVEDNGVGRAYAQKIKSKSAQTHKSHGLALTSERLEMIRSLYGVQTDIQIEDLFTPEGAAAGTRVNIRIA